jgi:aryl-alcohol dehydrogenase-like predicted oxidoreductase
VKVAMPYRNVGRSGLKVSALALGGWTTFGDSIKDRATLTRAELALAWLLGRPGVSSLITGAVRVGQLENNMRAAVVTISDSVLAAIDAIFPPDGVRQLARA